MPQSITDPKGSSKILYSSLTIETDTQDETEILRSCHWSTEEASSSSHPSPASAARWLRQNGRYPRALRPGPSPNAAQRYQINQARNGLVAAPNAWLSASPGVSIQGRSSKDKTGELRRSPGQSAWAARRSPLAQERSRRIDPRSFRSDEGKRDSNRAAIATPTAGRANSSFSNRLTQALESSATPGGAPRKLSPGRFASTSSATASRPSQLEAQGAGSSRLANAVRRRVDTMMAWQRRPHTIGEFGDSDVAPVEPDVRATTKDEPGDVVRHHDGGLLDQGNRPETIDEFAHSKVVTATDEPSLHLPPANEPLSVHSSASPLDAEMNLPSTPTSPSTPSTPYTPGKVVEAQRIFDNLHRYLRRKIPPPDPFYAISVKEFETLGCMRKHEWLLANGLLVDCTDKRSKVIFVVHQWLGQDHPDPQKVHYSKILAFAKEMQKTLADEHVPLWIDYCCIPQNSIEKKTTCSREVLGIVRECSSVLVVCPSTRTQAGVHAGDCHTTRGWCAFELLARVCFDVEEKPNMYIIDSHEEPTNLVVTDDLLGRLCPLKLRFSCCASHHLRMIDFSDDPLLSKKTRTTSRIRPKDSGAMRQTSAGLNVGDSVCSSNPSCSAAP